MAKLKKGIDARITYWLHNNKRKFTLEQQIAAAVSSISLCAEQNSMKKLCFTGSLYGQLSEDVVSQIMDGLKKEGDCCAIALW